MIPTQEMVPYPVFGDNAIKVQPDDPKYAAGFDPGDVLPAEWLNWFLSRASGAVTKLNAGALSMEREINNVLTAGSITPDAEETDQLITAIAYLINQAVLTEQQKPAVGVPTLWMGTKPDWALDFGNGAATQYLWANYPKLNNAKFKDVLTTLSTAGWMSAYDASGFYVPDLRGVVPIGYGTNAVRAAETLNGGSVGGYSGSQVKYHNHGSSGSFSGNAISGQVARNDSTVPMSNGAWTQSGALSVLQHSTTQAYSTNTNTANRTYGIKFSATPSGTVSVTVNYNTSDTKQASKPATIGCMWIVRYE